MSQLITVKSLNGDFQVPRDSLMVHDYFRAMLQVDPVYLLIPFPQVIVEDILGRALHGDRWEISSHPNVWLGLEYCQLIAPVKAEPVISSKKLHDVIMDLDLPKNIQTGHKLNVHGLKLIRKTHEIFRFLSLAKTEADLELKNGDETVFQVTPTTYHTAFDLYEDFMTLKPQYLALLNRMAEPLELYMSIDNKEVYYIHES